MSSEEEKIMAIVDKAAVDALGKQLGKPKGAAHATITATGTTIDVLVEFTPSLAPIPPTAYHNVFPPITPEGIQKAAKRLRELRAQRDKEDAEILAGVPMREPLPQRIPDLCPDDRQDEVKP